MVSLFGLIGFITASSFSPYNDIPKDAGLNPTLYAGPYSSSRNVLEATMREIIERMRQRLGTETGNSFQAKDMLMELKMAMRDYSMKDDRLSKFNNAIHMIESAIRSYDATGIEKNKIYRYVRQLDPALNSTYAANELVRLMQLADESMSHEENIYEKIVLIVDALEYYYTNSMQFGNIHVLNFFK
ncbi:hypothetical protein ECANGB1_2060 [Enterospora canceri]|uniref:Uncharacterized protein n=1 Tax=Enterospora canceri TaxID=1081671 RepID=A0A1Y1S8U1_9MICR|nr:hypothetical protein ECANGB1_2060 [Enterospora canceri]